MSLTPVELLKALAAMYVTHRHCWPKQLSFTEYVALLHRICIQLSTAIWSSGVQLWLAPTLSMGRDDIGIILHVHFDPIPLEVIALAATVVRIGSSRTYPGF